MIEAPTCTVGPSRPTEAPHNRPNSVMIILPIAMRIETRLPRVAWFVRWRAAIACGMPLPWLFGKVAIGEEDRRHKSKRRHDQRGIARFRQQERGGKLRLAGQHRQCDGCGADRDAAKKE